MPTTTEIELFLLKCAVIERERQRIHNEITFSPTSHDATVNDTKIESYIKQFSAENRRNAAQMARYYEIFYMLENDIRILISETMENTYGSDWWDNRVSAAVKEESRKNKQREMQAAITPRSDNEIDYTTFGQLWDIIRENWEAFAGMLSNQSAVGRVLSGLNMLRGTIAHCGLLADDEIDRLKLAIKDWFRVLEGPKN